MADATVKTVQYVDPRIEPQPDPVYDYVIGPTQNQYYKIAASGLSNSSINFNNLTTLGVDRAYLDTFEIELSVTFDFILKLGYNAEYTDSVQPGVTRNTAQILRLQNQEQMPDNAWLPFAQHWVMQSFPFNTVCEQARVNINGGAFFSEPMAYLRAKERYMNQKKLSNCYENVCPVHKPQMQTESGRCYDRNYTIGEAEDLLITGNGRTIFNPVDTADANNLLDSTYKTTLSLGGGLPTRLGYGVMGFMQSDQGMEGGFNNEIVKTGGAAAEGYVGFVNYKKIAQGADGRTHVQISVTWREPIFVSPFSSRYDATYGRPLYNITSMDLTFNLCDLQNMIRIVNFTSSTANALDADAHTAHGSRLQIESYTAKINSAQLCYQVMTIPPTIQKPLTTLVPYRRFVPYITDYNQTMGANPTIREVAIGGGEIEIGSGVFTLNEIPTAIWIFTAPAKTRYQHNEPDTFINEVSVAAAAAGVPRAGTVTVANSWDSNKLFGGIRHLEISMANTTQILSTADPLDLYRIAKANGCEDSYVSWYLPEDLAWPRLDGYDTSTIHRIDNKRFFGAGSVLRLKPGVDIIIPDQQLIPGANANNMVFYCRGKWYIPPHSTAQKAYALWILFEYVGVAAISPGQCEISMNPLGSGEIMSVSPVMSATSIDTEGTLEGSGFWDGVKRGTRIAGQIANEGILSRILKHIPHAEKAAEWAAMHGLGAPASKRKRDGDVSGGAVLGKGLGEWV